MSDVPNTLRVPSEAFPTITAALREVKPFQTIHLTAPVYTEIVVISEATTNCNGPFVIEGCGPDATQLETKETTVTILKHTVTIRNLSITVSQNPKPSSCVVADDSSVCIIENCDMSCYGDSAINSSRSSVLRVNSSTIRNCDYAICCYGIKCSITSSVFVDNGTMMYAPTCSDCFIEKCVIANNATGVFPSGYDYSGSMILVNCALVNNEEDFATADDIVSPSLLGCVQMSVAGNDQDTLM